MGLRDGGDLFRCTSPKVVFFAWETVCRVILTIDSLMQLGLILVHGFIVRWLILIHTVLVYSISWVLLSLFGTLWIAGKRQENLEIYFPSLVLVLTKKQNVRILDEMELLVVGLKDYCIKSICVVKRLFRE